MVAPAQTQNSSTWAQSFVYGQSIDQIVMIEQADVLDYDGDTNTGEVVRNFYHRNALGSVMFISEPDETEAATYRYTPYGEVSIERGGSPQGTDPLGQSIGFTGRWRDAESGLWHYRARAHSSAIGRFLQRDPLGYEPGPNVYEYCWSGPTYWTDPDGCSPEEHTQNKQEKNRNKHEEAEAQRKRQQEQAARNPNRQGASAGHGPQDPTRAAERARKKAAEKLRRRIGRRFLRCIPYIGWAVMAYDVVTADSLEEAAEALL